MKLYEFEGKQLLARGGILTPLGDIIHRDSEAALKRFTADEVILKAQMLEGKRGKNGYIFSPGDWSEVQAKTQQWFKSQKVASVLIEEKLKKSEEYYVSCLYNTIPRQAEVVFSAYGGTDIEELSQKFPKAIVRLPIDALEGLAPWQARQLVKDGGLESADIVRVADILVRLYNIYNKYDCRVAEINPLIKTVDGELIAADAKIELDDNALFRLPVGLLPDRLPTEENPREKAAKEIDSFDYRGSAGSTYIDLPGDIGVLASGGGASMMAMDMLIGAGGRPANFTEYSGNPPRSKVKRLTEIVLSKPNLKGLWIVGATANFTDIFETLMGVVEGLRSSTVATKIPIVIRRAGPRDEEAFAMLRKIKKDEGFDLYLFGNETSIGKSAEVMVEKTKK